MSDRKGLQFIDMLSYGEAEVMRILKNASPYLSLHTLDDVVSIGAASNRIYIAQEGAIVGEGGVASGEALSSAAMNAAVKNAEAKQEADAEEKTARLSMLVDDDGQPKERMISAIKSLAFDILRAVDETDPPEALEHSIETAHQRIKAYRATNEPDRIAEIMRTALSIDVIESERGAKDRAFVFSEDRERWKKDGTEGKRAAEIGMQHAVLAQLKCRIIGVDDSGTADGMWRYFEDYRRAEYEAWKYRQEHEYDWYGPERLSGRAVLTIRRIANKESDKLDKQALKILNERGYIRPFRTTKWRLTAKGQTAIKFHDERDAWIKLRTKDGGSI